MLVLWPILQSLSELPLPLKTPEGWPVRPGSEANCIGRDNRIYLLAEKQQLKSLKDVTHPQSRSLMKDHPQRPSMLLTPGGGDRAFPMIP